jgi:hypothetical protein
MPFNPPVQQHFIEPRPSPTRYPHPPLEPGGRAHSFLDPGDDLRGPGDSENKGGQKAGDRVGGHGRMQPKKSSRKW